MHVHPPPPQPKPVYVPKPVAPTPTITGQINPPPTLAPDLFGDFNQAVGPPNTQEVAQILNSL